MSSERDTPATHELKTWPEYFAAIWSGVKTFEFRKDDRTPRFEVGNTLHLREYDGRRFGRTHDYTGRECRRTVTYIARGGLIPTGYCVMALRASSSLEGTPAPATWEIAWKAYRAGYFAALGEEAKGAERDIAMAEARACQYADARFPQRPVSSSEPIRG